MSDAILQTRYIWQAQLLELLRDTSLSHTQALAKWRDLVLKREQFRSALHQQQYERNKQLFFALIQRIQQASTKTQYEYLQKQLADYREDLLELAGKD